MRNPCIEKGLVKNVRVRVAELHHHIVRVELLRDQSTSIDGRFFYLPRISFDFQPRQTSWTVERRQFPLQPGIRDHVQRGGQQSKKKEEKKQTQTRSIRRLFGRAFGPRNVSGSSA
jgi:hypothetical protein